MVRDSLNYSRVVIIAHGKTEIDIFTYILRQKRQAVYIYGKDKGRKSIQINSLLHVLNKPPFDNYENFVNKYSNIKIKNGKPVDFVLGIVMDTDDCTIQDKNNFLNKEMFKGHWLYEYILPIHNTQNLEDALNRCGIKYPEDKSRDYRYVFTQYVSKKTLPLEAIKHVSKKLERYPQSTNMYELINYCLSDE